MAVLGVTKSFFSPSLYFSVSIWPSTPATAVSTLALVMVACAAPSHRPMPFAGAAHRLGEDVHFHGD